MSSFILDGLSSNFATYGLEVRQRVDDPRLPSRGHKGQSEVRIKTLTSFQWTKNIAASAVPLGLLL